MYINVFALLDLTGNLIINYFCPYVFTTGMFVYLTEKGKVSKCHHDILIKDINHNIKKVELDSTHIKDISSIVEVLRKNINDEKLYNLYSNLNTIKIINSPTLLLQGAGGSYSGSKNELKYALKSKIPHELLHAASAYNTPEEYRVGFKQSKNGLIIGEGLNEGYNDLLARRYFNARNKMYDSNVIIARLLELFFKDYKDMEDLNFKADLEAFVKYMENKMTKEEIMDIIFALDRIHRLHNLSNPLYKLEFIKLQLKLYEKFKASNKSLIKEIDFRQTVSPFVDTVINNEQKTKKKILIS